MAILAALVAGSETGEGQLVHTSLLGWTVNVQVVGAQIFGQHRQGPAPAGRHDANDPHVQLLPVRDGTWIALGMVIHSDRYWPLLCQALGRSELVDDARFASFELRDANHRELIDLLDELFGQMTYDEWQAKVVEYDLIACRVNSLTTLQDDEQVLANDYMVKLPHPELGEWWYAPTPVEFEKTPVSIRSEAPHVGQRTDQILGELGYSPEEIVRLRELAVV